MASSFVFGFASRSAGLSLFLGAAVLVTSTGGLGCSKNKESDASASAASLTTAAATPSVSPSASASASASSAALVTVDAGPPVLGRTDPRFALLPLFGKLQVEKDNQPAGTLHFDDVYEALTTKLSLKMSRRTQLAGFPVSASYCEKSDTELAVDVVVCEYPDEKTMKEGKDIALKNKTARRDFVIVRTSWVSITRFTDTPEASEQSKKIAALVKTL